MQPRKPTRRSVLKAIAGTAAFTTGAGVGSAENRQDTAETHPESPFDFEYRTVGDDIREAVGHLWWLLTVDRDRIDELLAKSSAGARVTRQKREAIQEVRSTYEVELERNERNERELTYHLVDSTVRPLHEEDVGVTPLDGSTDGQEATRSIAESVGDGLRREAGRSIEPEHSGEIHRSMAALAVEGTDHDHSWVIDAIEDGSTDPDQWAQKCQVCSKNWMSLGDRFDLVNVSPDVVERELRQAIRAIDDSASPHHMYAPGGEEFEVDPLLAIVLPPYISLLEVEVEGAAPRDAQVHWERATDGYTDWAEVGRAFHFMQDMSQPLHTGAIGPQVLDTRGTVHHAYKRYVEDNWVDGNNDWKDFRDRFQEGVNSPQWDGSMEAACKTIANDSSNYSEQVYETIVDNGPNNPEGWDDVVESTAHACMWFIGAYSRGAINQL